MNYQPKHMREQHTDVSADNEPVVHGSDSKSESDLPQSEVVIDEERQDHRKGAAAPAHPLGIPIPDPGDGGEYVPIPGEGSIESIAPNGAVIRNPWAEQPEIKPDYAYTDEQDDMNLLIM